MERSGLRYEHFFLKIVENRRAKKSFFPITFFTFEVPFNGLLPPLPKVGCPIFLEIWNPWGKVTKRSGLTFEHFCFKWSKMAAQNKFFFADFNLVHPPMASVLLSASVERCFVTRMRDFSPRIQKT